MKLTPKTVKVGDIVYIPSVIFENDNVVVDIEKEVIVERNYFKNDKGGYYKAFSKKPSRWFIHSFFNGYSTEQEAIDEVIKLLGLLKSDLVNMVDEKINYYQHK